MNEANINKHSMAWLCRQAEGNVLLLGSDIYDISILLAREGFSVDAVEMDHKQFDNINDQLKNESVYALNNVNFKLYDGIFGLNGTYDSILLLKVIEQLLHPHKLLNQLHQILNNNGKLALVVPYGNNNDINSYYLYDFVTLVEPYFDEIHLEVSNRSIYYIGRKKETIRHIDSVDSSRLVKLIKREEQLFKEMENLYIENQEQSTKETVQINALKEVEKYKKLVKSKERELRNAKNKIRNLTSTASTRYKIGDAIIEVIKKPAKIFTLPITIAKIYRESKIPRNTIDNVTSPIEPIMHNKRPILFLPTNGAGLGHLTRLLAIARRIRKISPDQEIIFLSTSSAMHLILQEGFLGYHLPSKMLFPEEVTSRQWNYMLQQQLETVINLHQPKMLVFDGAYPYAGIIASTRGSDDLMRVWVKRGMHKGDTHDTVAEKEKYFDYIIVPGEAGENTGNSEKKRIVVDPVIYLDTSELLSRNEVRKRWGIPDDGIVVYLQLGAGNINDIQSDSNIILESLLKRPNIYVVLGESIIGKRMNISRDRVIVIRDYPNSMYYSAFDLAISAAGYNTYHELMYFGIPSIFIPNENTKTDDQMKRAKNAESAGAAIILTEINESEILKVVEKVLSCHSDMKRASRLLVKNNGADDVAKLLLEIVEQDKG